MFGVCILGRSNACDQYSKSYAACLWIAYLWIKRNYISTACIIVLLFHIHSYTNQKFI